MPERGAGQRTQRSGTQIAVGVENHRAAQARQSGGGEQARSIEIHQTGIDRIGKLADLARQPRRAGEEAAGVGGGFLARGIRAAIDALGGKSEAPHAFEEGTVSGQPRDSAPAALAAGRQQVEQAVLRATGVAELIQQQKSHARTAKASTQKYTGSTRQ